MSQLRGKPPDYADHVRQRIERARQKAHLEHRYAWHMGKSAHTGADMYTIRSAKGEHTYIVSAYPHPKAGGYCYSLGQQPMVWVKCTCDAFALHTQPCWHSAKVQIRLEREYQQEERNQEDDNNDKRVEQGEGTVGDNIDGDDFRVHHYELNPDNTQDQYTYSHNSNSHNAQDNGGTGDWDTGVSNEDSPF